MNVTPIVLSLELAAWTALLMLPLGLFAGRALAWRGFRGKSLVEAAVALPLVLPPTVLGYYLLVAFNPDAAIGGAFTWLTGEVLAFSFPGLVAASMIFNLPFAVLPMQQAFAAIPHEVREAAWVSGLSGPATLARIELPLAWPGVLAAFVLTFTHTLGEFGVVLMVGYRGWTRHGVNTDTAATYTERFLNAFGIQYYLVETGEDAPRISVAFEEATRTRRPVAVLVGDEYHGFNR